MFFQASPTEHLSIAKHLTAEVKREEFISGKGTPCAWLQWDLRDHFVFLSRRSGRADTPARPLGWRIIPQIARVCYGWSAANTVQN